jgi:transcriptional regulator with XRE-family HTH domain
MDIRIEEASDELMEVQTDLEQETPDDLVGDLMDVVVYQISRRLDELDWTQQRLADEMGVSAPQVSRLLRATENTSLRTIARAACALDLTVGALKLVPNEEADEQVDEIKSFVGSKKNGAKWWPITRKRSSHMRERLNALLPDGAKRPTRNTAPATSVASGFEGLFWRRGPRSGGSWTPLFPTEAIKHNLG